MSMNFDNDHDNRVYAAWVPPLLENVFGDRTNLHHDLYELTHLHRREHNGGIDDGPCTAWPSPPYRAPVWRLIVEKIGAKRFLEVGTAMGYTAALMADAGGLGCQVDTIEIDPDHADQAEAELGRRGLLDRVHVLRGDTVRILPMLTVPYDVVFADGGHEEIAHDLSRLTRPGGAQAEIKGRLREPLVRMLGALKESLRDGDRPETVILSKAREEYRSVVWAALERSSKG